MRMALYWNELVIYDTKWTTTLPGSVELVMKTGRYRGKKKQTFSAPHPELFLDGK